MELISARRGIRQVYSYSRFRMENFLCEHRLFSNIQYALDISIFNVIFQVCKSYPRAVVVPASISDETLKYSAVFRNSGRFPVLSYRHTNGVSTKILFQIGVQGEESLALRLLELSIVHNAQWVILPTACAFQM